MTELSQIRVWDPLVRFFHWSLVCAFIIAYLSEDDFIVIHSWSGYLILLLLCVRFIWGLIGTHYARFSNFIYSKETIVQFLKDTLNLRARRYLGHNPAGGAMIILLMVSLLITTISGVILLGADEHAGPVAYWFTRSDYIWADSIWVDILEEGHELFANFTLLLIFIHIAGVFVESRIHNESLVSAMITGFKENRDNTPVEDQS